MSGTKLVVDWMMELEGRSNKKCSILGITQTATRAPLGQSRAVNDRRIIKSIVVLRVCGNERHLFSKQLRNSAMWDRWALFMCIVL